MRILEPVQVRRMVRVAGLLDCALFSEQPLNNKYTKLTVVNGCQRKNKCTDVIE